jgi:1,4-dihydroxy-2-naphthoyl-CoA hydrolase
MSIWFNKDLAIEQFGELSKGTMDKFLGIEWTGLGENFVKAKMPVDHRTIQPYGMLHGGASCVLAETIGNFASAMVIDHAEFYCVGLEINANHVRPATRGYVTAVATPLHVGATTHVWDIKIFDEEEKLICVSRLTVAILKRKK